MCSARRLVGGGILFVVSMTSVAWAQYGGGYGPPRQGSSVQLPPQMQQRQQARKPMGGEGTVMAVRPGAIQLMVDGNAWVIHLDRSTKVRVTGPADAGALKPGQFVRFQAEFDEKGTVTAPIDALEVVTPQSPAEIGIFPAADSEAPAATQRPKRGEIVPGAYRVVGKLGAIKQGEILVAAGSKPLTVKLAEAPKVHLDVADYSLARQGDKAAVKGWFVQPGTGYANEVSIVLGKPEEAPGNSATSAEPAKSK